MISIAIETNCRQVIENMNAMVEDYVQWLQMNKIIDGKLDSYLADKERVKLPD